MAQPTLTRFATLQVTQGSPDCTAAAELRHASGARTSVRLRYVWACPVPIAHCKYNVVRQPKAPVELLNPSFPPSTSDSLSFLRPPTPLPLDTHQTHGSLERAPGRSAHLPGVRGSLPRVMTRPGSSNGHGHAYLRRLLAAGAHTPRALASTTTG